MIITDFEPGDATRYYVIWDASTGMFGFGAGTSGPMQVFLWEHYHMDPDTFARKLGIHNPWTLAAAMLVFSHLTGSKSNGPLKFPTMRDVQERWGAKGTWQQQLAPLRAEKAALT